MDDVVDFNAVDPDSIDDLRTALIHQMDHLTAEVDALRSVVGIVPDAVQDGRPTPGDLTMKEIYGLIATLDRDVRPEQIRQVTEGETPTLAPPDANALARDAGWNARDIHAILDAVDAARADLVATLRTLQTDAWSAAATYADEPVTLAGLVHCYAQADLERLRTLGHRLHDADLSDRSAPAE